MVLYPEIQFLCAELSQKFDMIPKDRKKILLALASTISETKDKYGFCQLVAICTHNSRRSQAAQLWLKVAASYYNITEVYTYSGGTEATAFNFRMITAMERLGFLIETLNHFPNPKYHVSISEDDYLMDIFYSKKYDESYNPQSAFIALVLCGEAEASCPVVKGALERHYVPFDDPSHSDGLEGEYKAYADSLIQIGREILYCFSKVKR
jgi:protein-tyrosine-phosphatase